MNEKFVAIRPFLMINCAINLAFREIILHTF